MFEFFEIVVPMDVNGFAVEPMPAAEPGPDLATLLAQATAPAPESPIPIESPPPPSGGDPFDVLAGAGMGDLLASTSPAAVVARDAGDGFVETAEPVPAFGFRADGGRLAGGPSYTALDDPNSDADGDGYPDKDILVEGSPDGIDKGGDTGGGGGESGGAGGTGGGGSAGGGDGGGGSGGTGDQPAPPPSIEERVTIDPSVPPEDMARALAAEQKLEAAMRELGERISALGDDALIQIGDKVFTGAEVKAMWSRLSFTITQDEQYGPKGAGQNDNGLVRINLDYLERQLLNDYDFGKLGSNWLILHELSHILQVVRDFTLDRWNAYLATDTSPTRDEWQTTSFFDAAETYTNDVARRIASVLGVAINPLPPGGYSP